LSLEQLSSYSNSLLVGLSGDRKPVGARFSMSFQNVPAAHPAFCKLGIPSLPRVKLPERGVADPPPSRPEVEEIVELQLSSPSRPSRPV